MDAALANCRTVELRDVQHGILENEHRITTMAKRTITSSAASLSKAWIASCDDVSWGLQSIGIGVDTDTHVG